MNDEETLETILNDMDIPPFRKNDLGWLIRNIQIRNSDHPKINEALNLIKTINKKRRK